MRVSIWQERERERERERELLNQATLGIEVPSTLSLASVNFTGNLFVNIDPKIQTKANITNIIKYKTKSSLKNLPFPKLSNEIY